jgi:hypothetical protein
MAYDAKELFFLSPAYSTAKTIKNISSHFSEWLKKHSHQDDLVLHHYTTFEGLKGILQNRSIRFSHTSTLNDPSEISYGKHLVTDVINEIIALQDNNDIISFLQSLINDVYALHSAYYEYYVACFCKSENLLSQWRSYASLGGGYNLALEIDTDTKFYHKTNEYNQPLYIVLRKILYDKNEQKTIVSQYLNSAINELQEELVEFEKNSEDIPLGWSSVKSMAYVNILFDFILSFKNNVFAEEEEWRLILGREASHNLEQLAFKETKDGFVPYIEIAIINERDDKFIFPVHKVKCGPMLDFERTKPTLNLFIKSIASTNNRIKIENIDITDAGYRLRD